MVNTASIAGLTALPFFSPYHASKFAVISLSESLSYELTMQHSRVRVSVLCPGFVRTNVMDFERNRPRELQGDPQVRAELPQAWYDSWNKFIAAGTSPSEVADHVINAIRQERFWVFPHPELLDGVRARFESILEERNPVLNLPTPLIEAIEAARIERRSLGAIQTS